MKRLIVAVAALLAATVAVSRPVALVAHNQRSSSGTLSTLKWNSCAPTATTNACLSTTNAWTLANATGSTAVWDWNPNTGLLSMTGTFQTTSFVSSNANGSPVISDKVTNMVINTGTHTTTATAYSCIEGTFLAGVGANGCLNLGIGNDFLLNSSAAYNVGGNANCVVRTIGGDDTSTGNVRTLANTAGGGGCDAGDGAFNLWMIVRDDGVAGGTLILSNGIPTSSAGTNYLTFQYLAVPTANADSATTISDTPVTVDLLGNDTGFGDPVTVLVATAPQHGAVTITGSPGPKAGIVVKYTPNAGFVGADSFQYSVSDGATTGSATVSVSVVSGAKSSAFAGDWPGFQANAAHTGYVPGSLNTAQFSQRWQIQAAAGLALNPVAVGDGKVFVSAPSYFGNSGLYAYDLRSGAALWNVGYSSLFSINPPAYANGRVYIQTGKGTSSPPPYLRAYDSVSGQLAFQATFGAQWESYYAPTIVDDVIYVNGGDYGGMYAFSASNGGQRWFQGLNQYDDWTPAVDSNYAYAYLGEYSPALYVLNRETGQAVFNIPDPNFEWDGWSMNLAPVLGGANDVIAIHDGRLIRFSLASRTIAWERQRSFSGQPSVAKGVIYAIDSGALTAWDQNAGTLLWSWAAPSGTLSGPMIVTDSHVLVSGSGAVYAVNLATRSSDWNYPATGSLALAGHSLLIASANGNLTAIRVGPPGAYDDEVTAYRSTPIGIDVLKNDDGFGNPVTVGISAEPQHGTATVTGSPGDPASVRVSYTPEAGYVGPDAFEYAASDGVLPGTARVTVDVRAPQTNADAAQAHLDTPVSVDVLKNDTGFADPVTVSITTAPQHGTAQVTGSPGSATGIRIRYTPAIGYSGPDSLQYQVSNGLNTGAATVSLSVLPYKAKDDNFVTLSGNSSYIYVASNDVGFQDPVTLTIISGPTTGSAHVDNSPGTRGSVLVHYSAASGTYTDTITYELSDGTRTDRATLTIRVVPYIAQDDEVTTAANIPVTVYVTQNDLGFGYSRILGLYSNPQHGTATVDGYGYDPAIVYYPTPGFVGDDSFQYAIDDGTRVGIATVTVHVINDADNDQVDDGVDNCLGVANTNQRDADGDGYGSLCDADFNNDGRVNFADLAIFRSNFATADPVTDMDGNGAVNFGDLARFKSLFGRAPGPSAQHP